MRDQAKCCSASLILHLLVLAVVLALPTAKVKHPPSIIIDFNLVDSTMPALRDDTHRRPVSQLKKPARRTPSPAPVQQKQDTRESRPAPVVKQGPEPVPAQAAQPAARPAAETSAGHVAASLHNSEIRGNNQPAAETESRMAQTEEKARQLYRKEQFAYIRNLIMKQFIYPQQARRMGWSGKVTISFIIRGDGGVSSIRVAESSGYPVLDRSAMDTVKKAAPFPKPPVSAEIVIPILFKLT